MNRESMVMQGYTGYYHYDGRGSVANITGLSGETMVSYIYTDFGVDTAYPGAKNPYRDNPYRYNGERLDYIHGAPDLQFLRARYYDAASGRFTSRDTYWGRINVPLSQNLYTYTMNNPVKYADPSGHYVEEKQAYLDQIASLNEQISAMQNVMYNSGLSTRSAIQDELDRLNRALASSRDILDRIEGRVSYQQAAPKQDRMIQAANTASMRVSCDVNPSVRYIDPWEEVQIQAKSLTVGNIWAILRNTTEPLGNLANQIYGWFGPFEGPIFDYNAMEFVLYQEFGLDSVGFYTGKAIGDVESMAINALLMFSGLSGYAKGLSGFGNIGGMSGSGAALSPSLAYAGEGVLVSAGTSVGTVVLGYGFQNAQSDFDFAKKAWDNSWFGPDYNFGNSAPEPPNKISLDPKQVGKKYGEHIKDYPSLKDHAEYTQYAEEIFNAPDRIIYDKSKGEYYYLKGNDLLRIKSNGDFVSLYPGAQSQRVLEAIRNGGTIWP